MYLKHYMKHQTIFQKMKSMMRFSFTFFLLLFFFQSAFSQNLLDAIKQNDFKNVQALVNNQNINEPDENGATPLMWAVYKCDLKMAQLLIEKGADVSKKGLIYLNDSTYYGNLVGIAAGEGKLDVLKFLIEDCGIDVNDGGYNPKSGYEDGDAALKWSKEMAYTDISTYLVEKGAIDYETIKLYTEAGDFENAALEAEPLIPLLAKIYGPNDTSHFVINLLGIASLFDDAKNYPKAEKYYLQAIEILDSTKTKDKKYEYVLMKLANIYDFQGKYSDAIEKLKIKLNLVGLRTSINHPEYASILGEIGLIYQKSGFFDKALDVYNSALDIFRSTKTDFTYDLYLNLINKTAGLYEELNQYEKAHLLYVESFENTSMILGQESPEYVLCKDNLDRINNLLGKENKELFASHHQSEKVDTTQKSNSDLTQLNNMAISYMNNGLYDKALPILIEAMNLGEQTLGKENISYVNIIHNLAQLYHSLGQLDHSVNLYQESLLITERIVGKENSLYGTILCDLAEIYSNQGQYDVAMNLFLNGIDKIIKFLGKTNYTYLKAINNQAILFYNLGEFDKSISQFLESLEITQRTYGKENTYYLTTLNNLAQLYNDLGYYDKALTYFNDILENTERILGKNHSLYGISLNNLALLYYTIGQFDKALPYFLEAIENIEKSLGKDNFNYGIFLSNLALNYDGMGQYDKALPLFIESLERIERVLGKDNPNYWKVQSNLASLFTILGQYDKALPLYIESLEYTERSLGKEHPNYGGILNNCAVIYIETKRYDQAFELLFEANKNLKKSLGDDHSQYINTLNNLSMVYSDLGQFDKALPFFLEALEKTEKSPGIDSPNYILQLNNLAQNYSDLGQYEKALPLFLEALERTKRSLENNYDSYGLILKNLAGLYYTTGQYDKALDLFQEAQQLQISLLKQNFSFLSESEQENYTKTISSYFELYQSFYFKYHPQSNEVGSDAYNLELSVKGMILQSGIQMRQAFLSSADSAGRVQFEEWLALRQQINFLLNKPVSESYASVDSLKDIANTLERSLMQQSQEFSNMQSVFEVSWKDVQQGLKENEAAIELISFNYHDANWWTDSTYYAALVVRKTDSVPQMLFLFEEADLIELLPGKDAGPSSYDLAYKGSRASGVAYFDQTTYQGDSLYKLIWKPIDSLLQDVEKVYFSPSGLLHRISMAALPHPETGLLMDHYQLVQLSSTRQLAVSPKEYKLKDAVVFGGIDYELPESMLASLTTNNTGLPSTANYAQLRSFVRKYNGFSYLQGSMDEATVVSRQLSNQISTTTYTKHDATEEKFMALSDKTSPSVIHIATHGFYFPDTISEKHRDEMMITALGEDRFRASDDPLMRSALVMAGANYAWAGNILPSGLEDGILTAKEVSYMNLSNTKLVVLSACQTGLGDVNGSEGITGLQRAFKMAGVEYLIMSLWSIPDKETREFMEFFYNQWPAQLDIYQAFTETQKQMRNKYPHEPYKWAGFVLVK